MIIQKAIRSQIGVVLLVVGLLLCLIVPFTELNMRYPNTNSGVFQYVGWRILNGQFPYKDVWDHKPPVVFYLNALAETFTPYSRWGIVGIEVLFFLISALLSYRLLQTIFNRYIAVLGLLIWLWFLNFFLQGGNITEEYALVFQFGMLALFLSAVCRSDWGWRSYAIGLLGGAAFSTKQTSTGIMLAIGIYVVGEAFSRRQFRAMFTRGVAMTAGALTIPAAFMGLALAQGWFSAFIDATVVYNLAYSSSGSLRNSLSSMQFVLQTFLDMGWPLLLLSSLGLGLYVIQNVLSLISKRRSLPATAAPVAVDRGMQPVLMVAALGFGIDFVFATLARRGSAHYIVGLFPTATILAGYFLYQLNTALHRYFIKRQSLTALSWIIPTVLVITLCAVMFGRYTQIVTVYHSTYSYYSEVSDYIESHTAPTDTVLLLGTHTTLNLITRRTAPSRFVYQLPLLTSRLVDNSYASEARIEGFYDDLLTNKPRLIIDTTSQGLDSPDAFAVTSPRVIAKKQQLAAQYTPVGTITPNQWTIYQRLDSNSIP